MPSAECSNFINVIQMSLNDPPRLMSMTCEDSGLEEENYFHDVNSVVI